MGRHEILKKGREMPHVRMNVVEQTRRSVRNDPPVCVFPVVAVGLEANLQGEFACGTEGQRATSVVDFDLRGIEAI